MTKKIKGGKVIAAGGFGCIFKPALKCENSEMRETNKISKLMTSKHGLDEYNKIQSFKTILQTIPNYEDYFLLNDFTICKPDKLTKDDLDNYNKKCKALKKKDITSKNINDNLDKILSLNMPDGGIDVGYFIQDYFAKTNIIHLNNSLINLLVNGIIPMNQLNVYHCDIKDANILVNPTESTLKPRLIDWGLSVNYDSIKKNGIPKQMYKRPFQYNSPFSSILFNNDFANLYDDFLKLNKEPDYYQIREFVVNYIFIWNEKRGSGHLSAINDIVKKLTINELTAVDKKKVKDHLIEYDFTYYYIIEYLSKILEKYTRNGSVDIMSYFKTVFIKNVDIWGFTMTYVSLYEYLYESFETLSDSQMQFILKVKYIIIHFLYECPIEPINTDLLIDELTNLNTLIESFDTEYVSDKISLESGGKIKRKPLKGKTQKHNKKQTRTRIRKSKKQNKYKYKYKN